KEGNSQARPRVSQPIQYGPLFFLGVLGVLAVHLLRWLSTFQMVSLPATKTSPRRSAARERGPIATRCHHATAVAAENAHEPRTVGTGVAAFEDSARPTSRWARAGSPERVCPSWASSSRPWSGRSADGRSGGEAPHGPGQRHPDALRRGG